MRLSIIVVAVVGIAASPGCKTPVTRQGCEVSCKILFDCGFMSPEVVPTCTSACTDDLADATAACIDAVIALGECGADLTCADFAAGACQTEQDTSTAVCNGVVGPDAALADAASLCGNNIVDPGEECDDGDAGGDGCDSQCHVDGVCIVSHDGGTPAKMSSANLNAAAMFTGVRSVTLAAGDTAPNSPSFSALAACGRRVYAAVDGNIARVDIATDGALTAGPLTPLAAVHSLVCDETRGLLYAFTHVDFMSSATFTTVTSYTVAADGALATADALPLSYNPPGNAMARNLLVMLHPVSREPWVIGYAQSLGPFVNGTAYRIAAAATGVMTIAEGPADIGASDIGYEAELRADGGLLVMTGYSGGCTGAWPLTAGRLPTMAESIPQCSGNFGNGQRLAVRANGGVHYSSDFMGALRILELSGTTWVDHGTMGGGLGGSRELALAYDDSILVGIEPSGTVRAYQASTDGLTLTPGATTQVPVGGPFGTTRDAITVRCAR